ncbi:phytanoyl-CoA dioxygenase family protein [Ramlibacter sp. WS9]|uniref:phytanoyl-CoA dioxygenase family protein n=1 Tax=Ramlibacter sp. WS9 TaxID=1882741 RepID=UPI001E5C00A3|nr:phytanoyl-CoA dioxygenase family protein [Ramlibacter sp. WS9]
MNDSPRGAVPSASYGVLERTTAGSSLNEAIEQVRSLGYAVLESGCSAEDLGRLSRCFDGARLRYVRQHGQAALESIDEHNNIRLLMAHDRAFLDLALRRELLAAVGALIPGKFLLNQQNGIINPPNQRYNQGAWHRDLPYQHFVSSTPLAVNALFCIDDFTVENGATFVLPASHKSAAFPSPSFVERNALQVQAKAGQFLLMDCMAFHSGGHNGSGRERRAVNHVFSIPYFKQQIRIPGNLDESGLTPQAREILGFAFQEPASVTHYLASRTS